MLVQGELGRINAGRRGPLRSKVIFCTAEQRGPLRRLRSKVVSKVVIGVLARAIKHILLHRTGENSCC